MPLSFIVNIWLTQRMPTIYTMSLENMPALPYVPLVFLGLDSENALSFHGAADRLGLHFFLKESPLHTVVQGAIDL